MIPNNIDYTKYLSKDNGHGLLLKKEEIEILTKYNINYQTCTKYKDLITQITKHLAENYLDDTDEIEEILSHLEELHYYQEVHK